MTYLRERIDNALPFIISPVSRGSDWLEVQFG